MTLLLLRYEPMPIQQVVGSISGEATPIFDTPGVKAFVKENKAISFPIYGPLEEQLFSFSGAKHAIDHVISRYADHGIHVDWSNLTGIRLSFKVRADNIESAEPIEILIERGDS